MATEAQKVAFMNEIGLCAQKAYKEIGKVLPSICIGMACVESAYGGSKIMSSHNAYFGQKVGSGKTAKKYWDGTFYTSKTKEEYTVGVHTTITDAFRSYKDMQQCVNNFYELLNTSLYSRVQAGVPFETQMAQIKQCGYMTSSTEVNSVINLIKKYGLTKFDNTNMAAAPVISPAPAVAPTTASSYTVGNTYTLQVNLYIRREPMGDRATANEVSSDARANSFITTDGVILKKGTRVTCKEIKEVGGAVWIRIPSGWVCARTAGGKVYIS